MTEDSQQISVSELLKRNGQQVESRGGRRRRGVKGGISVAELTGEIPVVRDQSESRALDSEPESAPALERKPAPEPAPTTTRSVPADERTAAFKAPFDDDGDDDDEPIASRPAVRRNGGRAAGTSRDHQGAWVSRSVTQDRAKPAAPAAASIAKPVAPVPAPPAKAPEPAPTLAAPRVQPSPVAKPPKPVMPEAETKAVPNRAQASVGTVMPATTPKKPETAPGNKGTKQEPGLLSGSTLAGDLMRQSRDTDAANAGEDTELIAAATDEAAADEAKAARAEPDTPRRSRKEAKAEAVRAAKAANVADDPDQGTSAAREWAVLAGQGVIAVIAGALLFKGFEKLWDVFPWVALILALLVIVGLVAMVRILRRTDDITSFVIAVVVGMIVTLGPLAFMLASG
ncbi:hypothetical protein [Rhodococcus tibetensis]|uniref:Uncharacterized protein n=1 Tax=Rhodococcus tibetensis TaxID=2965064 RepID=A0ABT1QI90_9NOCA|nr:hypothetical protein [Rhodococcus sp. FXJ9.536]MCQ4121961.1 hypothetical protein [Rhodococcus sp. FXJ9.536]